MRWRSDRQHGRVKQSARFLAAAWFGLCPYDFMAAQEQLVPTPDLNLSPDVPAKAIGTFSISELESELARRRRDELDRLRLSETKLSETSDDEVRRDLNASILDNARQMEPDAEKVGILSRAARLFSRHNDIEDARAAAKEIAPTPLDPAAFERAKALVVIAEAERMNGQAKSAWWSLHEAQEIALRLRDQEQALAVFRQIGDVETKLSGGQPSCRSCQNDALIEATIKNGLPNPGFEEVEILRAGGGPLREPQVIRHVYFPTGARKFQGPMLRGGQTIVRIVHPCTHCPCDCHVVLPRGAPIIEYTSSQIHYVYPDVKICLQFRRNGECTVQANQFDASLRKWSRSLMPDLDESGFWFFGGENNALKNTATLLSGPVLNVGSRLPITSGLIRPEEKRIRNTLRQPRGLCYDELFKRSSVR